MSGTSSTTGPAVSRRITRQGGHTFRVQHADGSVTIETEKDAEDEGQSPRTGDAVAAEELPAP